MSLDTARLRLLPYAPEHLRALLEGVRPFEEQIGLRAADGLRDFIVSDDVSPAWLSRLRTATSADPWVHGFAVEHRASHVIIGSASFKGPPDEEGVVEIAYGIAPGYQGCGYATEAAAALVAFALGNEGVRLIRAHTSPTRNASTSVLVKCGFHRLGEVEDAEDGLVWRWERTREAAEQSAATDRPRE